MILTVFDLFSRDGRLFWIVFALSEEHIAANGDQKIPESTAKKGGIRVGGNVGGQCGNGKT